MNGATNVGSAMTNTADGALSLESRKVFAQRLRELGALQFGRFTLKDGAISPVYCDLRLLISDAEALRMAGRIYAALLADLEFDRIAAIPYAGLPLGAAAVLESGRPMVFPRKQAKSYGAGRQVEGSFEAGETAVLLDDLVSSGASKVEAVVPLEAVGLIVRDIVVLVDRRRPGATDLEAAGYRLHSAFRLEDLAEDLSDVGDLTAVERAAIEEVVDRSRS